MSLRMIEYIKSFFLPNDYKFCYIVGSFAKTAPNFRTPDSDIDIVCSNGFDEFEIRYFIKQRFPYVPSDIHIDISKKCPDNGIVTHTICYWQNENEYIMLRGNRNIRFVSVRNTIDLPSVVRDPNKTMLSSYLNHSKIIDIGSPIHFSRSVNKHYGFTEFNTVLNNSSLDITEKTVIRKLLNDPYTDNIKIDRDAHTITNSYGIHNIDTFMHKN